MQQVELVDQLIDVIRSLCERPQVRDQSDVVGLGVEFLFERRILHNWQTMAQGKRFAENLVVGLQLSILNVLDILQHELDAGVKHFNGDVLRNEMFGN